MVPREGMSLDKSQSTAPLTLHGRQISKMALTLNPGTTSHDTMLKGIFQERKDFILDFGNPYETRPKINTR